MRVHWNQFPSFFGGYFVPLDCVVDNKAHCDQHARAHQREKANDRMLGEDIAARAVHWSMGTLLLRCARGREAIVVDDVFVMSQ